jgi:hypothetical protein
LIVGVRKPRGQLVGVAQEAVVQGVDAKVMLRLVSAGGPGVQKAVVRVLEPGEEVVVDRHA